MTESEELSISIEILSGTFNSLKDCIDSCIDRPPEELTEYLEELDSQIIDLMKFAKTL